MTTEFRRWRKRCALTQEEAARRLGLSRSRVVELDTGHSRRSGAPGTTDLDLRTRLAMAAILADLPPYHDHENVIDCDQM